ncbi:MAG: Uma2 family endonuclease [Coleofasciculaceae cyanobacterium]
MSMMTIKDLEQVQSTLKQAGYDYQLELENGQILIVGLSDIYSSEIGVLFSRLLTNWVYPRRLGRVFDPAGGFILPNSDLKAPDVSFVRASRLRQGKRYFAEMVPDLVVEIKSQSDRIKPLIEKINMFLSQGAIVGILIDPDLKTVTVYRLNGESTELGNGDALTIA